MEKSAGDGWCSEEITMRPAAATDCSVVSTWSALYESRPDVLRASGAHGGACERPRSSQQEGEPVRTRDSRGFGKGAAVRFPFELI
jgi:hypothetical protein